ncbi:protein Wnt-4-like [Mercenaria mercenaria]|uniref:protein Wnt-4-like n=1 Tax=Mercenaria mercenaria TaxID=6596 RepID=UPI001E1E185E|nr:protein Wnt-4-like [Mercenaria mercenaria]
MEVPVFLVWIVLCNIQLSLASWWYLGVLGTSASLSRDTRQTSSVSVNEMCNNSPYLEPRQRELCAKEKRLIDVISAGASMGIEECKHQFSGRRWNCTTFNNTDVFGNVIKIKSRETAYIYSISSAGVMYSVTRACAQGTLIGCGCDDSVRKQGTEGKFEWGGCSENLQYGAKFSEEFVDSKEQIQDRNEFGLMNLWNNKAGRLIARKQVDLVCKCHGVSGSCSVKICWRKMRPFRAIGSALKEKFDGASLMKINKRGSKLRPISKDMKRPTRKDLVYLENSPDFCEPNLAYGSLGTRGRECKKDSYGLDGCNLMCCGRGYYTIVKEFTEDCDCKFFWCCRVECQKCRHVKELHYCN